MYANVILSFFLDILKTLKTYKEINESQRLSFRLKMTEVLKYKHLEGIIKIIIKKLNGKNHF
jgi:hypothetical protein